MYHDAIYFIIIFLFSVFIFYQIDDNKKRILLVILSCGFIAYFSITLLLYIILFALINFFLATFLALKEPKKVLFWIGITFNILQIIILKYSILLFYPSRNIFNLNVDILFISSKLFVPIGISYFTLQSIGYMVNIYRGWEKPEKLFTNYLLYITFFPKFLSGPIERSNHFLPQLKSFQKFNENNISYGLRLILLGMFKKVAIADQLAPFVLNSYNNIDNINSFSILITILVQPLYLYFDFSGYTNIAIGAAKTFGFELLSNFKAPFLSENMTTFWKRFHISLSSWFHDYVFKPLSFKYRKKGISASVLAVFITWLLFGIWHGAGWNFMILGILQAAVINYEYFTKKWRNKMLNKLPSSFRIWFGRIFTYLFYSFSLIFFFSYGRSFFPLIKKLMHFDNFNIMGINRYIFLFILFIVLITLIAQVLKYDSIVLYDRAKDFWRNNVIIRWVTYFLMLAIILVLNNTTQQFIYFQF